MNTRTNLPISVVLCILAAMMATMLLVSGCSGSGSRGQNAPAGSSAKTAADSGTAGATTVNDSSAGQEVYGWWQTLGQSGSVFHHFTDNADYVYMRDQDNATKFTFYTKMALKSIDEFPSGAYADINEPGVVVLLSNGSAYFLMNSSKDTLQSRNADGSGYSGSSSLVRVDSPPSELLSLAEETETAL